MVFGAEFKLRSFSLCSVVPPSLISLLCENLRISTLSSNALNLCYSLMFIYYIPHLHGAMSGSASLVPGRTELQNC